MSPEYEILFTCDIHHHQLSIIWKNEFFQFPFPLKEHCLHHWQSLKDRDYLFNGRLSRLVEWFRDEKQVTLVLQGTDYQSLMFSNAYTDMIVNTHGSDFTCRALGVSCIVNTLDDQIVLLQRSHRVGEYPGFLDMVGGHVDFPVMSGARPDPFASIQKEIFQELNVTLDLDQLKCLGLINASQNNKPELIFIANLSIDFHKLTLLASQAQDSSEYDQLLAFDRFGLHQVLEQYKENIAPSALGATSLLKEY